MAEQELVDPLGAVRFVAAKFLRKRNRISAMVGDFYGFKQLAERLRFMLLAGRNTYCQRMSLSITQQMDSCRKTPARAA